MARGVYPRRGQRAAHLAPWQFHNLPKERLHELAVQGGKVRGKKFNTNPVLATNRGRKGGRATANAKFIDQLAEQFDEHCAERGYRSAVVWLWRTGKRSGYDAAYSRLQRRRHGQGKTNSEKIQEEAPGDAAQD